MKFLKIAIILLFCFSSVNIFEPVDPVIGNILLFASAGLFIAYCIVRFVFRVEDRPTGLNVFLDPAALVFGLLAALLILKTYL